MCEHHGGKAWLVIDSAIRRDAMRESMFGGLWLFQSGPAIVLMLIGSKRSRSIDDLARRLKIDPGTLRQTLDSYNAAAQAGSDPLGKSRDMTQALEKPPFYAMDISAARQIFPCPALTLGGLRVEEGTGAVADGRGGSAVPGLYAAGRAAVGVASNHYVSGLALADCIWSGAVRVALGRWRPTQAQTRCAPSRNKCSSRAAF